MKNETQKVFNRKSFLMGITFPLFLVGCNMMEGAGTDIKHAGQALEHSAERNKERTRSCPCCASHTHSHRGY